MGYLSRIEALLETLLNGTEPSVTTPQSRVEAHLHAMINGDEITDDAKSRIEECLRGMMTDTVPQEKPKSRIEACIHAIITGSNPPEEPKSRSEVYLHAIWDKYHGGSEEPEEPELPEGVLYSLVEPTTFNGTSDYIDTGIKLYDTDKDFTIMVEFEDGSGNSRFDSVLHCMYESDGYIGLTVNVQGGMYLTASGTSKVYNTFNAVGVTRLVIVKNNGYFVAKMINEQLSKPKLITEGNVGYVKVDNNLLLGAYQDTSGTKGRFWNGTIHSCVIHDSALSDEEINAFLMGEEEPITPTGIIWSETAEYNIDSTTGEVVSGDSYVSEPFSVESGYVYELATPAGGSWNTVFVYDLDGTFKYFKGNPGSTGGKGTVYFDGFENQLIRLSIHKESDELNLSTVVPVKTDRIWSVGKYKTDSSNGNIYFNGTGDYFTLQKIPVEGGATYKFSTTGTHKYLKWFEYTENGTYLGYIGGVHSGLTELEAPVAELTTHVILCAYTGEIPVDDYATFVKTADAPQKPENPVEPIDVVWLTGRWDVNKNDGTFTPSSARVTELITEKIPVEGGATYLFSTTGSHNWLKMFKYANDIYLGYDGDVSNAKTLEVTVSPNTTHIVLAMSQGEDDAGSYATLVKTADAPEQETGLVYELAEPVTLNGTSDYIDTGIKLYDEDKDFTILMEIEEDEAVVSGAILHCMYEDGSYQGVAIDHGDNKSDLLLTLVAQGGEPTISFSDNGKTRIAIVKSSGHYTIRYIHDMLSEPIVLVNEDKGFMGHDNPLVIGAYRTNSGTYGRFWNGTIHNFKVYSSALSDEETTAFLMGA